ncbi:hypothetical protein ANO11243_057480 [Dothideomycetidae sp. 11243]|nr:hypothetical protein ANO11243_057480 [fungal sp. No.11243]
MAGLLAIEKLKGPDDWPKWSQLVQRALLVEGLGHCIARSPTVDDSALDDAKALLIIHSACSPDIQRLLTVREHTAARSLWKQLRTICDRKALDWYKAYEEYCSLTYQGNAEETVQSVRRCLAVCRMHDIHIDERVAVYHFLKTVQDSFPAYYAKKGAQYRCRETVPCLELVLDEFVDHAKVHLEGHKKPRIKAA